MTRLEMEEFAKANGCEYKEELYDGRYICTTYIPSLDFNIGNAYCCPEEDRDTCSWACVARLGHKLGIQEKLGVETC